MGRIIKREYPREGTDDCCTPNVRFEDSEGTQLKTHNYAKHIEDNKEYHICGLYVQDGKQIAYIEGKRGGTAKTECKYLKKID